MGCGRVSTLGRHARVLVRNQYRRLGTQHVGNRCAGRFRRLAYASVGDRTCLCALHRRARQSALRPCGHLFAVGTLRWGPVVFGAWRPHLLRCHGRGPSFAGGRRRSTPWGGMVCPTGSRAPASDRYDLDELPTIPLHLVVDEAPESVCVGRWARSVCCWRSPPPRVRVSMRRCPEPHRGTMVLRRRAPAPEFKVAGAMASM